MIDMSSLYSDEDYPLALESFNLTSCKWSSFTDVHLKVSQNRCPICECLLDKTKPVTRLTNEGEDAPIISTIDHYRPQTFYSFLKCDHENYLLMCFECNSMYKESNFPLHSSTPIRATNKSEIINEKPLIVNPIKDNIYELFELVFKRSDNGKSVLELIPKSSLDTSTYLYQKALQTIKLFGLYDCENNRHSNDNVHNCRIEILETHFGLFYNVAQALKEGNKKQFFLELQKNENIYTQYGFYQFILKGQFSIAV